MSSAATQNGDAQALRRQLILAQVRLLELEDKRDEQASRLAVLDRILAETQSIANDRIAERNHLAKLKAGLEAQSGELHRQLEEIRFSLQQGQARVAELEAALRHSGNRVADYRTRLGEMEAQLRTITSSWSWRWTAPLRSLGRLFHRTPRE